jgi:hypothetical protein
MSKTFNEEVRKLLDRISRNDPTMTEANLRGECA